MPGSKEGEIVSLLTGRKQSRSLGEEKEHDSLFIYALPREEPTAFLGISACAPLADLEWTWAPSDPLYFRLELLANAYRMHHPERKKLTQSGTFPILPRLPSNVFSFLDMPALTSKVEST